jgi:restriction system protein
MTQSILQQAIINLSPLLWWLIPFLLILILSVTWSKGPAGERVVSGYLKRHLDDKIYKLIHNVTLDIAGDTTQIDHIVVSKFGIFVIETKNYSGWIFGNEKHATWTQSIYGKTYRFQNPLRQNYKHLKALEITLNVSFDKLKPVIVFVGKSEFKTHMPDSVTSNRGVIDYILRFTAPIFTDYEVEKMNEQISRKRLSPSFKTNRRHVKDLKARLKMKNGLHGSVNSKFDDFE